jgi:hypothetical protein
MSDHKGAALIYPMLPDAETLIADKDYDSDAFREALAGRGITPCIPPRAKRRLPATYCKTLYRQRHKGGCPIEIVYYWPRNPRDASWPVTGHPPRSSRLQNNVWPTWNRIYRGPARLISPKGGNPLFPATFVCILHAFTESFQAQRSSYKGFQGTKVSDTKIFRRRSPTLRLFLHLIFVAAFVFSGPSLAQKLVDPNSVAPEFRDAAEKRRAEQIRVVQCNRKANEAKVLPRDRTAYLNHCLETADEK